MSLKKQTGSYYTPTHIAEFLVKRSLNKLKNSPLKILEPSAGDGEFVRALARREIGSQRINKILAVEIAPFEAKKITGNHEIEGLEVICNDFLEFQSELIDTDFDLIIGNPPYIKRNYLSDRQIKLCSDIKSLYPELSKNTVNNIWSAFLIRSISLIGKEGILALVLPAELLQVKYAKELRELLVKNFDRVEIFTFNELLFKECKGQDTVILLAEKVSKFPGLFFCNIEKVGSLQESPDELELSFHKDEHSFKWTSHTLSSSECLLIDTLAKELLQINDFCSSKAGIVTAANDFFILNKSNIENLSLEKYVKPIIQKASVIDNNVVFGFNDFLLLSNSKKPCFILDLNNISLEDDKSLQNYIFEGVSRNLHRRYKMLSRKKWFEVPNIGETAPALFFKRSHEYPKLIKNEANALATDSAYLIHPREGFDVNSIVFSFYNSLTLIFAELHGRYYGGGVLELTPNEFKGLPLPYFEISSSNFNNFSKNFGVKKSIEEICLRYDGLILRNSFPGITDTQIEELRLIRKKLTDRRKRL